MRIVLVISQLGAGGAERVASVMANHWNAVGSMVFVITFGGKVSFYELGKGVEHIVLGISNRSSGLTAKIGRNLMRIVGVRRAIRRIVPDAVISFMPETNVITLLATRGLRVPVIVSEHAHPGYSAMRGIWRCFRRLTYGSASHIVAVSEGVAAHFRGKWQERVSVIPNPVARIDARDHANRPRVVVGMGRLVRIKGFDLLMEAFAMVKDRHPEWGLVVYGEGPLRGELEDLRDRFGLQGRCAFPGLAQDAFEVFQNTGLFVLSSRSEGFGNVLLEAMACGLAVVAFDCPSGPREIIRDGVDGILVPRDDVSALAMALERLLSDDEERERLARNAPEIMERFGVERIMGLWEALLMEITESQAR